MLTKQYYVYILTNTNKSVLYTGVTNNLTRRIYEHKNKLVKGFTEKYNVNILVYYETTEDIESAIVREKAIKKLSRTNKNKLIEKVNPEWEELSSI